MAFGFVRSASIGCLVLSSLGVGSVPAWAQGGEHDHEAMLRGAPPADGWMFAQHGVVFAELNKQSGPRGGTEFVVPNWWMGIANGAWAGGQLAATGMFSLDSATVGKSGYRELFQVGEVLDGEPLIDRQHPHDFFMQLAMSWRRPIGQSGFTLAGGPVDEPALGPVAFMHRPSAANNPTAPLGHHTFDSTHIAFGVVTAALDRGPWTVEASAFNGREPDDNRWDFDFGALDSFSGRLWYRPTPTLAFQVSRGRLKDPEELEPGDVTRTTISGSWLRATQSGSVSLAAGLGRNDTHHGSRNAFFMEGARNKGRHAVYGRFEALQTELADEVLVAVTGGVVRNVIVQRWYEGGLGADFTYHAIPDVLKRAYGNHPFGARVFFRLSLRQA